MSVSFKVSLPPLRDRAMWLTVNTSVSVLPMVASNWTMQIPIAGLHHPCFSLRVLPACSDSSHECCRQCFGRPISTLSEVCQFLRSVSSLIFVYTPCRLTHSSSEARASATFLGSSVTPVSASITGSLTYVVHLPSEECYGGVLRNALLHVGPVLPHDRFPLFLHPAPVAPWYLLQLHSPALEGIWASLWSSPPQTLGVSSTQECAVISGDDSLQPRLRAEAIAAEFVIHRVFFFSLLPAKALPVSSTDHTHTHWSFFDVGLFAQRLVLSVFPRLHSSWALLKIVTPFVYLVSVTFEAWTQFLPSLF